MNPSHESLISALIIVGTALVAAGAIWAQEVIVRRVRRYLARRRLAARQERYAQQYREFHREVQEQLFGGLSREDQR